MTWEIALGIFALFAFVLSIIKYIRDKNSQEQQQREDILLTLTKLNTTVDSLNATIEKFQTSSDKIHNALFDRVSKCERDIAEIKGGKK